MQFSKSLLIVGSGGREHAIAWKLSQSSLLSPSSTIYVAPGNGATALPVSPSSTHGPTIPIVNVPINSFPSNFNSLLSFSLEHHVGLVVIGPEDPLAAGITDMFTSNGIACFGPSKAAAQLESSKSYAKQFMIRHNIPTAKYHTFNNIEAVQQYLSSLDPNTKLVVKASGLAAGKGVIMCHNVSEAISASIAMLVNHRFGVAGELIVIEEWLEGVESSLLAFCDGKTVRVLPAAQDHKRIYEFDQGLNTGGMGAFAPSPIITPQLTETIIHTILQPCCDGCQTDGHPFIGIIFAGLMLTESGPMCLEFNTRFGDPETQVVLPLLSTDLLLVMLACIEGRLNEITLEWKQDMYAACICAVSEGYPEQYKKGKVISGLDCIHYTEANPAMIFQAGTEYRKEEKCIVTSGGRVLAATALAPSLSAAIDLSYHNLEQVKFEGMYYRKDIGASWHRRGAHRQPLRIGVLGSTNGTDLIPILHAIDTGLINANVEVVVSNKSDAGILEKAKRASIPAILVASKGKTREEFDREVIQIFHTYNIDLVLMIGFMRIISPLLIDAYYNRILNVHPSLLPDFAGGMDKDVHTAVLAAGRSESGCTIHLVDHGAVDHGPILIQKRCRIDKNETVESLKEKVQKLEGEGFIEAIQLYSDDQQLLASLTQGEKLENKGIITLYRTPVLSMAQKKQLIHKFNTALTDKGHSRVVIDDIESEFAFYIDLESGSTWTSLGSAKRETINWLLRETFEPQQISRNSFLQHSSTASTSTTTDNRTIIEVGPRMSFTSAWSTNACSICHYSGIDVRRLERFRRYSISSSTVMSTAAIHTLADLLHDRMTEQVLTAPLTSFTSLQQPDPWFTVPLLSEGITALKKINSELGLALDEWDQQWLLDLFVNQLKRDPSNVELFDISQSNSEHSRHWFFRGELIVDGISQPHSLMEVVKQTLEAHPKNSVIAFSDNSSAITGFHTHVIQPTAATTASSFSLCKKHRHLLLTAETHNFPSGVAPFPGAETGTGGRIRDTAATGSGSLVSAAISSYCVGQLHLPNYHLPWEALDWSYPSNLASPLKIAIEASNGASDYGNKFGEPVVAGFSRSFGMRLPNGERREWIKPIMFSAGIGFIDENHCSKGKPTKGMLVVKIGGPAYRIGMGGSAASSMVQGDNKESLDYNAVQRGDAEMEAKITRVIRACVDLGDHNPIISIHDQGAGGNCNVLKEIVEPAGGRIDIRAIKVGDETMSVLEIWGAEYQENWALLIQPQHKTLFDEICQREKAIVSYVGEVTGDGVVIVYDSIDNSVPVELDIETVLGKIPRKQFKLDHIATPTAALSFPPSLSLSSALDRVLRLLSVGSKRYLTNKVDRSVTGLVAQQPCIGPLQLPLADVAVIALSYFDKTGIASAVGEQPIKGLINPASMARLTVGESLTNIVWADLTAITDIKCSGNWMWAAKLPGEGAALYDAAIAMRDVMVTLGVAIDGGKDSLSMAARSPDGETVKAPGELVITLYCSCPNINHTITPDLKAPDQSTLLYIDLSGRSPSLAPRLGGSSLATVFNQLGETTPDMDDPVFFRRGWECIQQLVKKQLIVSGHDVSDGGLIVTILEMAFAGNCGVSIDILGEGSMIEHLFGEELGVVIEVKNEILNEVQELLNATSLTATFLGTTIVDPTISISFNHSNILSVSTAALRDIWEATSFELEKLQCNPDCVAAEQRGLSSRRTPPYRLTYTIEDAPAELIDIRAKDKPKVAIIREEGSNGDREMAGAFYAAGFDAWDVTMTDLLEGRVHLNCGSNNDGRPFRGVAFVGGFSYADVMDSAKGWAGAIKKNKALWAQFAHFYSRSDTFSLGVCNGCQLMALLGWVPFNAETVDQDNPPARFIHNASGRYESRWTTVKITESPSLFLKDMVGSVLGIWVSHGEGRAHFPNPKSMQLVNDQNLAPMRYVDDDGHATEVYPFNANGSPGGIAALTSADGRHLALMPHPERCHRSWSCAYFPPSFQTSPLNASPWLKLFQNARKWCDQQPLNLLYGANIEKIWYEQEIKTQLSHLCNETSLSIGVKKVGKVRDIYQIKLSEIDFSSRNSTPRAHSHPHNSPTTKLNGSPSNKSSPISNDEVMVLITTDRISAFDRMIACIPCKGNILNCVSAFWFTHTSHIIPNHILSIPHPNVTIARKCSPFPIEFVCRGYLTGSTGTSLWTHYNKGSRNYCGNVLPDGMKKNQKLAKNLITPTTKSDEHDRPISAEEIIAEGWMTQTDWEYTSMKALQLFEYGQSLAAEHGLILVDTKYEFGRDSITGEILLIDEIHTPDSSRYWIADSYATLYGLGKEPEMIDKEFIRLWYTAHCDPYHDAVLPTPPQQLIIELSRRYILLYEMITGGKFQFPKAGTREVATADSIAQSVIKALQQLQQSRSTITSC